MRKSERYLEKIDKIVEYFLAHITENINIYSKHMKIKLNCLDKYKKYIVFDYNTTYQICDNI